MVENENENDEEAARRSDDQVGLDSESGRCSLGLDVGERKGLRGDTGN
jgi:hypothetical protein